MARVRVTPTGFSVKAQFELTVDLALSGEKLYEAAQEVAGGNGKLLFRGKLISPGDTLATQGVKDGAMLVYMKAAEEKKQVDEKPVGRRPPEQSTIDKLEEMGYARCRAEEAVRAVACTDIAALVEWLSSAPEPMKVSNPLPVSEAPPVVSPPPKPQTEVFPSLGFSEEQSSHAYAWGYSTAGQLGTGSVTRELVPVNIAELRGCSVTEVACGNLHSLALTREGRVYEWGRYYYPVRDELEPRREEKKYGDRKVPSLAASLEHLQITQIAAGGVHSLAIDSYGRVWSWGEGLVGQLGHGAKQNELYPREVESLRQIHVKQVAAGNEHSVAVSFNGGVFAWGGNRAGQLGVGDFEERLSPRFVFVGLSEAETMLASLTSDFVMRVRCGTWHTVAETVNPQALYVWGNKSFAHEKLQAFSEPHMHPRLIECGSLGTYVLTQHGELFWVSDKREIVAVRDFSEKRISGIFCGAKFTICLAEDGIAYAKGENKQGQLGMGDLRNRDQFCVVERLSDFQVVSIACGTSHCVAIVKESGLSEELQRAALQESLCDVVIASRDGLKRMKANSLLLQSHLSLAQTGLEPTAGGFVAGVSHEALEALVVFFYSCAVPKCSNAVLSELREYGKEHSIQRLVAVCVSRVPPTETFDTALRNVALREIAERRAKLPERRSEPLPAEELKQSSMQPDVAQALENMRQYRLAQEEKRQRMLQSLEQRTAESPVVPPQVMPQGLPPQVAPPQPTQPATNEADNHLVQLEAERRTKREKMLAALEHRK